MRQIDMDRQLQKPIKRAVKVNEDDGNQALLLGCVLVGGLESQSESEIE